MFPAEHDLTTERRALVATLESLDEDQLEKGETLCAGWAPRDVLAHVIATDTGLRGYLNAAMRINSANQAFIDEWRQRPLDELFLRGREWAARPSLFARAGAYGLLGDNAVHHQDVLRPLDRVREIPDASKRAILREGCLLGARKLVSYRVAPTDVGFSVGRGRTVHGTAEALGMWLAGRRAYEPDLTFA